MNTTLCIRAKIIDPQVQEHQTEKYLYICRGLVTNISDEPLASQEALVPIYEDDLHISPGWFDPSVTFGEPGLDHRQTIENGLMAAASGGFTAVGILPNDPPASNDALHIKEIHKRTFESPTQAYPLGVLTKEKNGQEMSELFELHQAGAIAFTDGKKSISDPYLMKILLEYNASFGGLAVHAPFDKKLAPMGQIHEGIVALKTGLKGIPSLSESIVLERDCALTHYTKSRLHSLNISSQEGVACLKRWRNKADISAQTTINHLLLTDEDVSSFDTSKKLQPPLRSAADRDALLQALKEGVIDFVSADHTAIEKDEKDVDFVSAVYGSIGLESFFGALRTATRNDISICDLINLLSIAPRKRFGIEVPSICVGKPADFTLFQPHKSWVFDSSHIVSSQKNAALINRKFIGKPFGVIRGNQIAYSKK